MHPQELEAEVPMVPGSQQSDRVSGPSDSSHGTAGTAVSSLSPVVENARTPMAELGAGERGLGAGYDYGRAREEDEHAVSPNTDTLPSIMGRGRDSRNPDIRVSSPSVSEAGTWSPSTPVDRRGSRFQERWSSELNRD